MPPHTGHFAVPLSHSKPQGRGIEVVNGVHGQVTDIAAPFATANANAMQHDDGRKERRRRESGASRVVRDHQHERREDPTRSHNDRVVELLQYSHKLSTQPSAHTPFMLRLYLKSLERSALLTQIVYEEEYALESARMAWEEEREKVESEWRRGLDRVRERLIEGVEERRRRVREEKDGEGIIDSNLDASSRPHVTRKLRNKLGAGTSPPPSAPGTQTPAGQASLNPNSLQVEELPSPFPLALTSVSALSSTTNGNGRRKPKGGGFQTQLLGGLGKSIQMLTSLKDTEIDNDLGDIRRASKRRRIAATVPSTSTKV